jgi:glycosyltransferase involved in cell wall biosynthesis
MDLVKIADYTRVWTAHGLGGMQIRASLVATGFAQRGHQVHVFTTSVEASAAKSSAPKPTASQQVGKGTLMVHFIEGSVPRQYGSEYFDGAFKLFRQIGPFDIVHSNSSAARRHVGGSVPVVATWHGIGTDQDDINLLKIGGPHRTSKFDDSIRGYDHSIAVGPHEQRLLIDRGIPKERVHLVLPGMDETSFRPDEGCRRETRRQLNVEENHFLIGVCGRMVFDKGIEQVATAASKLDRRVKLLIVGEGPAAAGLRRNFQDRAIYTGACSHDAMPAYYNAMDLFINPTSRNQGFDLTTVEAMLSGTAVLVSDVSAAREVFVSGAEFFTLGDIADLTAQINRLAHREDFGRIGVDARRLAERMFTKGRMLDQVEAVFNAALG